ncbi:hypothetical protein BH09PLA1_BH09PLA1_11410 [soil metagenome]
MARKTRKPHINIALAAVAAACAFTAGANAGQISSMENDVNPVHQAPGTGEPAAYTWGDSFDSNQVNRDYSLMGVTDGDRSMSITKPAGGFSWGTQYLFNDYINQPGFAELVGTGTADANGNITLTNASRAKILMDMSTPMNAGVDYSVGFHAVNYGGVGGFFIDSYNTGAGAKNYQFTSGPASQTGFRTQTYTWDLGGQFIANGAPLFTGLTNYLIYHANVNSGNATNDSTQFWDNFRAVNENFVTRSTFNNVAGGVWSDSSKWNNGVPNGVGAPAIFYGVGAGNGSIAVNTAVSINSAITVGSIVFDSQITRFEFNGAIGSVSSRDALPQIVNYTIGGTGSLTFDVASGNAELYTIAGAHSINVPVTVNDNMVIDTSAGFGADANPNLPGGGRFSEVAPTSIGFGGTMTLASGVTLKTRGAGTASFATINGAGAGLTVNGGRTNLNGNVTVGTLTVASSAQARMSANGSRVIKTDTLNIGSVQLGAATATGVLDLNDNDMIVTSSSYSAITGLISYARHGGAWDRGGITSTAAAASTPKNKTLGTVTGAQYHTAQGAGALFDGLAVANSDILLKFTCYGDADLNGVLNFYDYSRIGGGFNSGGSTWFQGDFDYNNQVNFDDYSLIDAAFNTQTGSLRRAMSFVDGSDRSETGMDTPALQLVLEHFTQFGEGYATGFLNAVPEPTSAMLLTGLAALAATARRRRRENHA